MVRDKKLLGRSTFPLVLSGKSKPPALSWCGLLIALPLKASSDDFRLLHNLTMPCIGSNSAADGVYQCQAPRTQFVKKGAGRWPAGAQLHDANQALSASPAPG